jgi:hypothetical protein
MNALAAWRRERLSLARFGPIAGAHVVAAAWAAGTTVTPAASLAAIVLATLLITQFRLWDDIEDRDRDRVRHPGRVLAREPVAPFERAAVLLAVANVGLLALLEAWSAAFAVCGLDLAFWIAYRVRRGIPGAAWRHVVLLSKYPAFVTVLALALGARSSTRVALASAAIFAAAVVYEVVHDRPLPTGVTS